ncbi:hypothetical protein OAA48_00875 [bacterium]|nr:hypothetical protein [bacterium]
MGRVFVNNDLSAPNVLEIPFDPAMAAELLPELNKSDYYTVSPAWNSDIEWISNDSFRSYQVFFDCFKRLGLAKAFSPFVDCKTNLILYCGFFVRRSRCSDYNFHVDWLEGCNNNAFTLIAPLLQSESSPGLAYHDLHGSIKNYSYRADRAIVFGSGFIHSTDLGTAESPTVLLSLTFGTDKMEHWGEISKTAAIQSRLIRLPCGLFHNRLFD